MKTYLFFENKKTKSLTKLGLANIVMEVKVNADKLCEVAMRVFAHHLYEYNKGLRRLVLHTTKAEHRDVIIDKLERRGISYIIQDVTETKINVFFGADYCIDVLKSFPHLNLREFSTDKDFILGAMLGYDMKMHCRRYLSMVRRSGEDSICDVLRAV